MTHDEALGLLAASLIRTEALLENEKFATPERVEWAKSFSHDLLAEWVNNLLDNGCYNESPVDTAIDMAMAINPIPEETAQ